MVNVVELRPGERFEPLRLPPCEWCASDLPLGLYRCPHCGGPRSADVIRLERHIRLLGAPMRSVPQPTGIVPQPKPQRR